MSVIWSGALEGFDVEDGFTAGEADRAFALIAAAEGNPGATNNGWVPAGFRNCPGYVTRVSLSGATLVPVSETESLPTLGLRYDPETCRATYVLS